MSACARTYQRLNRGRRVVQVLALLFLAAVPLLNRFGLHWITGTLYSLSIGELDIVDPVLAMQTILLTKAVYVPLLFAVIVPLGVALIFGRVFCSWICPKNTFSDWLDMLAARLSKRFRRPRTPATVKNPSPMILWGILAALLLVVWVFDVPLLGYLSLPGIISSQIAQAIMNSGVGLELGLVVLILAIEVVLARRFWCTFLCPVGAFISLFRTKRTLKLCYAPSRCACESGKAPCQSACPLALTPKRDDAYPYCLNCGACVSACEKTGHGAVTFRLGR